MGRGSSKAGGNGGGGGDIDPGRVVSTEDMISNRGKFQSETDQVLTVARDLNGEYGYNINGNFQVATLTKGSRAMAYYDGDGNIAINQKYMNTQKMNAAYDDCVASGFHPSRGNKSGIEAVAAHEYGHALTQGVADKLGHGNFDRAADEIINKARGKQKLADFRAKVSGYGKKSNSEAIAEAVADVYCNGKKAKGASKAIVKVLKSYYTRRD